MFCTRRILQSFLIIAFSQISFGVTDGVSVSTPLPPESEGNATSPTNILTPTTTAPEPPQSRPETCNDTTSDDTKCQDCEEKDNLSMETLGRECLNCSFNCNCVYGQLVNVTCSSKVQCQQKQPNLQADITVEMICRYCYQTAEWEHSCPGTDNCKAVSSPREKFISNCTVNRDVLCLGNRTFPKKLPCNWTSGYRWSTAMMLSITLGGFGADRFYLGHWQEGIGKLFSFGGLGVWTIMDVILIGIRYLGPADGSLYI